MTWSDCTLIELDLGSIIIWPFSQTAINHSHPAVQIHTPPPSPPSSVESRMLYHSSWPLSQPTTTLQLATGDGVRVTLLIGRTFPWLWVRSGPLTSKLLLGLVGNYSVEHTFPGSTRWLTSHWVSVYFSVRVGSPYFNRDLMLCCVVCRGLIVRVVGCGVCSG